jgi:hypothetical protein
MCTVFGTLCNINITSNLSNPEMHKNLESLVFIILLLSLLFITSVIQFNRHNFGSGYKAISIVNVYGNTLNTTLVCILYILLLLLFIIIIIMNRLNKIHIKPLTVLLSCFHSPINQEAIEYMEI